MQDKPPSSFFRVTRRRGQTERPPEQAEEQTAEPESKELTSDKKPAPEGERARIVIPRQERGTRRRSGLDIELREVRHGTTARVPYLRVVPRRQQLLQRAPGLIEATELGSEPTDSLGQAFAAARRALIGSRLATSRAIHERLTKVKALAILSSDALSSSAYATEEMLIVLALAGSGAFTHALPIAGVIALLLTVVVLSYRQTIRAYPRGGGAYTVARENLGLAPGLAAAAALMVDYVLTVSVSVAAGVAAVTSAAPELHDLRVPIGVGIIALLTLGNFRGIRESGSIFAAPTYFFLFSMGTVIVVGLVKVIANDAPGSLLNEAPSQEEVVATQGLSLWLILRAFSSGGAALTGVEAISNDVPLFQPPESRNARTTLTVMAGLLAFLFLGITFLTSRYGLAPSEDETLVSALGREILGKNVLYYAYQVGTALVLFLAANTSFNAFPLLSAILAKDRIMPSQFAFRGDRLTFSNGIFLLAGAAALLIVAFGGEVTRLIPLYAIGVFASFTLSQSGMVRHWWRLREHGWRQSMAINGLGAIATGIVAAIITATKFQHGAWLSILLMAALMLLFYRIYRYYQRFDKEMEVEAAAPGSGGALPSVRDGAGLVLVPVSLVNKLTLAAMRHGKTISGNVTGVHIAEDVSEAEEFRRRWDEAMPDTPLMIIESPYRALAAPLLAYIESLRRDEPRITLLLPILEPRHWWERLLHNQSIRTLKRLEMREGVSVEEFPFRPEN